MRYKKPVLKTLAFSCCLLAVGTSYALPAWAAIRSSQIQQNNSVAVGNNADAIGSNDVAIGGDSSANGDNNVVIDGRIPYADSALGDGELEAKSTANVGGSGAASGSGATSSSAVNNDTADTAYGTGASVYNSDSNNAGTAIGSDATTNGTVALGADAEAGLGSSGESSVPEDNTAINGEVENAYDAGAASGNTAIGGGSTLGDDNIATGGDARAIGDGSVAIGSDAEAGRESVEALDPSTAVGKDADATGTDSEAYGYDSSATGDYSEALGTGSQATDEDSVAIGTGSTADGTVTGTTGTTIRGQKYTFAGTSPEGIVSVGSSGSGTNGTSETRVITNVAAGQISSTSTDAVNGSELYATNQAVNNLQATESSIGVLHYTNAAGDASTTPTDTASAGTSTTGPVTISNIANGTIAEGSTTAVNGNDLYNAEQGNAVHYLNSSGNQTLTPTNQAELGTGNGSVVLHHVGNGAISATSQQAVNGSQLYDAEGQAQADANQYTDSKFSLTCHRMGNGSGDIICGRGTVAKGQNATAQGADSEAAGNAATAYGAGSRAIGNDATALGPQAIADGYSTTAVGDHAAAMAPNSTAVGQDATALAPGSVALGYGSVAHRANSVSVGNAATGLNRQITNVAAGSQPHDAVNLQQLQNAIQGAGNTAQAMADKVGSIDASMAGAAAEAAAGRHRNTVAGSTAEYNGQASFAFAYQHRFGTHWAAMLSVGSNGQAENTAVDGAASYSW